uniref:Uncharacterized protein n=1 Tax=Lepeophtheirus salmonis TaxID=72036 RepID=A0A0K2V5Y1_LEPSM
MRKCISKNIFLLLSPCIS